ncbi:hypothetical protein BCR33DRAFT_733133 [Rhizoclosmatium globosum]|uniref:Uncharacterized protein n=1 Tax=Rhizoclosmatium globosum TaxID=329046 RepID=A0A1Y2D1C6_9FUNG|nr:hypothetical protein BCR33DRAFT_733133 [Rhizoclosmatium globosum]|eukprot:ORY52405.1 hypothetical protein BCR33DRAFT_733133 [Rhizoclosmatium globosum]
MSVYFLSDQTSIINSGQCGKCIRLTGDKGSVVVTVMDVMLNPDKSMYDVDLSLPAFQAITYSDGLGRANWTFVNCSTGLPEATATVPIPVPNALPTANGTANSNGTGIPAASAITTTKTSFATSVAITSAMMALAALSMI